jgi:hypothetical protein
MNTDDFEKQLQQQPLRPVPEHWRAEILRVARKVESQTPPAQTQAAKSWIHQLLWPCPQAWGALAAIWVVVFTLNFASRESEPQIAAITPEPPREVLVALKQQRQLRAELLSSSDAPVAEPPKWPAPHSRVEPTVQIIVV